MKKTATFLSIICFFAVLLFPYKTAKVHATNTEYLRVITEDTPFFSDKTSTVPLFFLPYTYYVKVLEKTDDLLHIECYGNGTLKIDGYTYQDMLFADNLTVTDPYLSLKVTTTKTTVLYADIEKSQIIQYIFKDRSMDYYGYNKTKDNSFIYYVGYNGALGYVEESSITPFTIENHPNPLTFIKPEEPTVTEEAKEEDFLTLKWAIIVCLAFAGIIAVTIAFNKNKKPETAASYYDENDYE